MKNQLTTPKHSLRNVESSLNNNKKRNDRFQTSHLSTFSLRRISYDHVVTGRSFQLFLLLCNPWLLMILFFCGGACSSLRALTESTMRGSQQALSCCHCRHRALHREKNTIGGGWAERREHKERAGHETKRQKINRLPSDHCPSWLDN